MFFLLNKVGNKWYNEVIKIEREKVRGMTEKTYTYNYNAQTDSLMIYLGTAIRFYSEEPSTGIYTIHDEETEDLIGIEILYYSARHLGRLAQLFPMLDFEEIEQGRPQNQ